jgi:hypothetical protein
MKTVITAVLLLWAAGNAGAETFYKWVDKNGVTHYTTKPPPDQEAKSITTKSQTPQAAQEAPAQAPPPDSFPGAQQTAADEARKRNCETARNNVQMLENSARVMRIDPSTKQPVEIDEAQRDAAMAEAQQAVTDNCG